METTQEFGGTHDQIVAFLHEQGITFRQVEHAAEGQTDRVSEIRGNRLQQAVKAMVITVKVDKKRRRHFLVCIAGHRRIDFAKVAEIGHGLEARFAQPDVAASLTGCVMGSVPPISFNPDLAVLVDPELLDEAEVVFNAGRLDRSLFVPPAPFFAAMNATIARVAQ
jgi:Ala-tRNA(Pro) deacylase